MSYLVYFGKYYVWFGIIFGIMLILYLVFYLISKIFGTTFRMVSHMAGIGDFFKEGPADLSKDVASLAWALPITHKEPCKR